MKKNYKLLAIDLDNTLLNSNGEISEKDFSALKHAKDSGIKIVICTGRSVNSCKKIALSIPCEDITVCFGGAYIYNMPKQELLSAEYMLPSSVASTLFTAKKIGLTCQLYFDENKNGDTIVVSETENDFTKAYTQYLGIPYIIDNNINQKNWINVPKVLIFSSREALDHDFMRFKAALPNTLNVSATRSFIEVSDKKTNKGVAVSLICKMLGISLADTVAVGDSLLDVPMLSAAGLGIAVSNSHPSALAVADFIAPSCDDNAISFILSEFF